MANRNVTHVIQLTGFWHTHHCFLSKISFFNANTRLQVLYCSFNNGIVLLRRDTSCTLMATTVTTSITRGGHSNRSCTCTRDRGQNFGQVATVQNLSSQRVKADFSWSKNGQNWSKGRLQVGVASFPLK